MTTISDLLDQFENAAAAANDDFSTARKTNKARAELYSIREKLETMLEAAYPGGIDELPGPADADRPLLIIVTDEKP